MEIAIARPRSRPSSPARSATKAAADRANDALFAEARGKDFTTPLWHWALPARESRFVAVPMRGAVDVVTHAALAWPITLPQGFSFAKQWTWQPMRPAHEMVQKKRWREAFPNDAPRPKDWLNLATGFAEPFGLRMHVTAGNDLSFCLLLTDGDEPLAYAAREVKLAAKHVEHAFLVTAPNKRGAGIGARILHNALRFYALLEIKTIGLTAGLSAGGAVWAKFGFRPVADTEWKVVKRKVRDNLRRAPAVVLKAFKEKNGITLKDAVRDIFGEKDDEGPRAIWDIVDLDHGPLSLPSMPGLDHGLAALLLRGTRWKGILDLEDEEAVDRVDAYLATKLAPRGQTPQTP